MASKPSTSPPQQDAYAWILQTLDYYGLGNLAGWLHGQITQGFSANEITLNLYQTPQFNARFPAIALRKKEGLTPLSPTDYVNMENSYAQILHEAGLPSGFYDKPEDFTNLIANDVSPSELQNRIQNAYTVVKSSPIEVRSAFKQFFGPSGDAALASYVMNPKLAESALMKQVQAAQDAGIGTEFGFGINKATAERLADINITPDAASTGFKQASMYQSLIHGGIDEKKPFGQAGVVAGEFNTAPGADVALQQALLAKTADFSGSGQAEETNTGITGLGKAQSI